MHLTETNPPVLIDVRTAREIEHMQIKGAVSMSFDSILQQKLDLNPHEKVVVVCQSGYRASIAASLLQAQGYVNISILSGGMNAWAMLK